MDLARLQIEAFKNIVAWKNTVGYANLEDGRVAVTPDRFTVFAIPEIDLCIDRAKMVEMPILAKLFTIEPERIEMIGTGIKYIYDDFRTESLVKIYSADNPQVSVFCSKRAYEKYKSNRYTAHITDDKSPIRFFDDKTGVVNHVILPVRVYRAEVEDKDG